MALSRIHTSDQTSFILIPATKIHQVCYIKIHAVFPEIETKMSKNALSPDICCLLFRGLFCGFIRRDSREKTGNGMRETQGGNTGQTRTLDHCGAPPVLKKLLHPPPKP